MACNLSGLLKRCFYTGWVGDHQDKSVDAKCNHYDIFTFDLFDVNLENYGFENDLGDSSDEEVLYQNEKLAAVTEEPKNPPERDNCTNKKRKVGVCHAPSILEQEMDCDQKEKNLEHFSMFDSDDSSEPGR